MSDMPEVLEAYLDQESLHSSEGARGVANICALVEVIGYKDYAQFGVLENRACVGSLVYFLQDNPGAIDALKTWIGGQNVPDWQSDLEAALTAPIDDE